MDVHIEMGGESDERLVAATEALTGVVVEHMLTTAEARLTTRDGRQFTIKVDNGSDIWSDKGLTAVIEEFSL